MSKKKNKLRAKHIAARAILIGLGIMITIGYIAIVTVR